MTGYSVSVQTGRVRAAEPDYLYVPTRGRGSSKYGVILVHGAGTPLEYVGGAQTGATWASTEIPAQLAWAGIPSVGAAMSGDSFGNPASQTDMAAALTLLGQAGCSTAKVHLLCISMGATVGLRYAGLNTSKVASFTGIIPLTSLVNPYTLNTAGLRAPIGTAWGVTYPTALPAGTDLLAYGATIHAASIPSRLYYSTADAIINTADVTAMGTALGSEVVSSVDSSLGHSEGTIAKVGALGAGNWSDYISFITAHGA